MEQPKEYYAFISYKREDEKWAKWLQYKLEHYRFPTNLNGRTDLPKSIRPTFRDVTDLNPGLLAEEINNALSYSEWLIVVCSPRSAKSPWVCKEAKTFIDLGRADHIIPFVIEGNPFSNDTSTECYPEALLNLTGSKELLAANINEMGRDAAAIKVVARMFNLRFDTLWQRHEREKRRKRWMWIGIAVFIALIGIGIATYFVRQNRIIESQNIQLHNLVRNLEEENNTYSQLEGDKKQYVLAGQVRGYGCDDFNGMLIEFHPYEPVVAFSDDWGVWLHYLNSNLEVLLPIKRAKEPVYDISEIHFSADGTELMADGYGMYIWEVETCKMLAHYSQEEKDNYVVTQDFKKKFPDHGNLTKNKTRNARQEKFRYKYQNGTLSIFQKTATDLICSTELEAEPDSTRDGLITLRNPVYNETLFIAGKRAALYDEGKKEFVLFFKGFNDYHCIDFSDSGEYLRIDEKIYARTYRPDTIRHLKYIADSISEYPQTPNEKNYHYDTATSASLKVNENSIIYQRGGFQKEVIVLNSYTMGNLHNNLCDAIFAGHGKIVAIVQDERHRVYSTKTWNMIGILDDNSMGESLGNEGQLYYKEIGISLSKYINNKLYILSSGAVIRVFDVDKCRLEKVIELPYTKEEDEYIGPIDKVYLADDASEIYYSFREQPLYYKCKLPQ